MSYDSLNLINGDTLTSSHIRHIEGGIRKIENDMSSMKTSLVNILEDKGIHKSTSDSFNTLFQEITHLPNAVIPDYSYSESVANIRDVASDSIKIVFDDTNNGQVAFRIAAKSGISVNWGDGTIETLTTSGATTWNEFAHKYTVGTGAYLNGTNTQFIVTITPLVANGISGFRRSDTAAKRNAMLAYASKDIYYSYIASDTFSSCSKLEYIYIAGGSYGISESQFSMASFCYYCTKLKTVYIPNVVWANVTSMSEMFRECNALSTLDMGISWNSINNTTMSYAFAACRSLTAIPSIKTNSVTIMNYAFSGCSALESIAGSWDLSACTTMIQTFYQCTSLASMPILNNMYNISSMSQCFYQCYALVNFNEDQEEFNTESCANFNNTFAYCTVLEEVPEIDFSAATNVVQMFYNCSALYILQSVMNMPNVVGTSYVYTDSNIRDGLDGFFYGCIALTTAPTIIAPQCLNVFDLFYGCTSLVNIPDISFPAAIRAHYMFDGCTSLINAPHHISLPAAQNVRNMFNGCVSLKVAPEYEDSDTLSFPNALYAYEIFNGCTSLVTPPKRIQLDKATHIYSMFYTCTSLVTAPTSIVAPLAQQVQNLFYSCTKMTTPPPSISFPSALQAQDMFCYCSSLLVCPELSLPLATNINEMFYHCNALTSTIPYEFPSATTALSFFRDCHALVTVALVQFGATCNINYFLYESGSTLTTIYFPEPTGSGKVFWTDTTFNTSSSVFTEYSNSVNCEGSNTYVDQIYNNTYLESISLTNFGGTLSVTQRAYLTSVRLFTPKNTIGNLTLNNNQLDAAALNQLFTDLPTVTTRRTINVRNNPGALTCDTSIATAKNWVVTVV